MQFLCCGVLSSIERFEQLQLLRRGKLLRRDRTQRYERLVRFGYLLGVLGVGMFGLRREHVLRKFGRGCLLRLRHRAILDPWIKFLCQ